MSRHFIGEIEKLKRKLLALSAVVEETVGKAVTALGNRDATLAREVIDGDDLVDQREVEVEEDCLKILALYQPVALDLRFLVASLKLNSDLERIGDLAVNIAEQAEAVAAVPSIAVPMDLTGMAAHVRRMLADALDSLVNLDSELAREVCAADDEADRMHRETFHRYELAVRQTPDAVGTLTHYLSVSRYLERIADHATNIAEDVLYMVDGEIVRHRTT